jgi:hypothetical protein
MLAIVLSAKATPRNSLCFSVFPMSAFFIGLIGLLRKYQPIICQNPVAISEIFRAEGLFVLEGIEPSLSALTKA